MARRTKGQGRRIFLLVGTYSLSNIFPMWRYSGIILITIISDVYFQKIRQRGDYLQAANILDFLLFLILTLKVVDVQNHQEVCLLAVCFPEGDVRRRPWPFSSPQIFELQLFFDGFFFTLSHFSFS